MALSLTLKKTTRRILDYLKGFSPREDIFALEGEAACYRKKCFEEAGEEDPRFILSNYEAFKDLDIGGVMEKVFVAVPRQYEKGKAADWSYIEDIFRYPVNDPHEIAERQAAISELQTDEALWNSVLAVKSSLDMCLYDERFRSAVNGLKALQDVSNIIEFVLSVREMSEPASKRLKRVKDFGVRFDADDRFCEAESFVRAIYLPYGLGNAINDNMDYLQSISSVGSRREFYGGNRFILEATERMITEEPFRRFVNDEARAVELLQTMRSKLGVWHKEMFGFRLSGLDLESWGKNERKRYGDLMEYWLLLVNEALYSRVPGLEIGELSRELGFYLGAAAVQRKWAAEGFPVTNPKIIDRRELKAAIIRSANTSLMERLCGDRIVHNDIVSDRDHNLFVITGPNNGGKTTYIRQVGQMYWLAHVGMGIPADRAELSAIDAIFTSFNTEDNIEEGTGLYLTELKRISQFSRPAAGQPRMSPYSIIFFDEFANGTDHEESVKRTKIVLEYLSQKGVTAYFTTHKHEIADMVEAGELPGAVNLGAEVRQNGDVVETTYRIMRNAKEGSYGHIQAEAMGITPESLHAHLMEEIAQGLYPVEDTRVETVGKRTADH
ncbi:MAG: DNA mismatch repair protein MutS [Syntrophus sp. SKADARSKE-3]|nr:DNA mismatch repair protein MutS [Syntrophus sp. SKADARSKE-3]